MPAKGESAPCGANRMNIILGYEAYQSLSGAALMMRGLAGALAREGHRALVVTSHQGSGLTSKKDEAGFRVLSLPGVANQQRRGLSFARPENLKTVRRLARDFKPDVVHVHDFGFVSHFLQSAARQDGVPVLAHHHFSREFVMRSLPAYLRWNPLLRAISWAATRSTVCRFYNRASGVLIPTRKMADEVLAWGVKSPIHVVSNGVDTRRFYPSENDSSIDGLAEDLKLPAEALQRPVLLYTGRLDFDKNLHTLLKAIPLILQKHPATFLFAGDGVLRAELEAQAAREPWGLFTHFLGFIPNSSDIFPRLYRTARISWTASPIEVQSLSLLEAMASGLPVMVARDSALPDLVEDGRNGYIIDTFDHHGYAEAALRIIGDDSLYRSMGARSRELAVERDINRTWSEIMEHYLASIANSTRYPKSPAAFQAPGGR